MMQTVKLIRLLLKSLPSENCHSKMINESNELHSPVVVRRHDHPPENRRVSK
ncbi:hypothetical protein PanWU01x14_185490, partial [Parasponia andersonii]